MHIIGKDLLDSNPKLLKFIVNHSGIIFSPASIQHMEITGGSTGIKYGDKGNALAGLITAYGDGVRIEIRNGDFSEEAVKILWGRILSECNSNYLKSLDVFYAGKSIVNGIKGPDSLER
jgi:hypothetical protein